MGEFVGTYIFICDIAGYISGAPIYYRNKAEYLSSIGWRVVILPFKRDRVYIKDAATYARGSFPFLGCRPCDMRRSEVEGCLDVLMSAVGDAGARVVVESGTDWTAYWAELLAGRLKGRHFLFLLDELNENIKDNESFFWWKYCRGEMAGITPEIVKSIFPSLKKLPDDKVRSFTAYCSNSIQDYICSEMADWQYYSFNIGSIGRLDKIFVPQICSAVKSLAESHENIQFGLYLFGGSTESTKVAIANLFSNVKNVHLYISGYLWPLPHDVLRKMNVFVGAAGSAGVPTQIGVPSICMDVHGNGCIGYYDELEERGESTMLVSRDRGESLESLLGDVLLGRRTAGDDHFDSKRVWITFCEEYQRQLDYVLGLKSALEYWDCVRSISGKGAAIRLMLKVVGVGNFLSIRAGIKGEPDFPIDDGTW